MANTVPALLAQKREGEAVVLLPRTSADLVGYEREGSDAANVEGALAELYAREQFGMLSAYLTLEEAVPSGGEVSIVYNDGAWPAIISCDPKRMLVYYEGVKCAEGAQYTPGELDENGRASSINLLFDADAGSSLEFVIFGEYVSTTVID